MYNWKLSTLFVIGLTLITGIFSNVAMAVTNDGEGTVEAAWGFQSDITAPTIPDASAVNSSALLGAGSTHNVLKFTYTAWKDRNDDDTADAGEGINMSGGRFRVTFPSGWKVSNKLIRVSDGNDLGPGNDGVVYETNSMGKLDITIFDDEDKRADANAKVTFEDRRITVNLGSEWGGSRSDAGRQLIIILGDVTVPIPSRLTEPGDTADVLNTPSTYRDNFANIEFPCSSNARNGTLSALKAHRTNKVYVKVGNILGDRDLTRDTDPQNGVPDAFQTRNRLTTRDPLIREFKVTPGRVFPGDKNIPVTITFEAPGPMYGSSLIITIPTSLVPDTFDATTVTVRSGGSLGTVTYSPLTIPINKINRGQRVTVSYRVPTVGTTDDSATAATTMDGSTNVNAKVMGGVVSAVAGSGRMAISPAFFTAGARYRTITLTYTAYTNLGTTDNPIDLVIAPKGILLDSDDPLQETNSSDYGYVSGSLGRSKLVISDADSTDIADDAASARITWEDITLKKNQTLRTTIRRVHISDITDNYEWEVWVDTTTADTYDADDKLENDPTTTIDERAVLSVVKTSGNPVQFDFGSIIDGELNPSGDKLNLRAGAKATIEFRFLAVGTPIRNGRVSLTIPAALGSAPTTAKDKPGRVTATSVEGELEANQPTVSGRTINVAIKQLDIGESVTIKYGTNVDDKESEKAVLHHTANDAISVRGTFRVTSGANTQTTRSVTIKLNNVVDGTGSVTLSPTSVEAGSNNRVIQVTFTAAGTMNGGRVSLEIPSGEWGLMQDDPTKRNYVTVRGSGGVSLESVNGTSAVATVRTLAKGGSFRFIYGGGTSSANNGVEVQNDPGIAAFTISSDGDGDGVFTPVTSDLKHEGREKTRNPKKLGRIYADAPGKLQIEVSGAADGTGTATVEPTEVRAAANDVRLVFTYTPSQTIENGELRFTVPAGWSKPQVDDLGQPGYTEVDGVGLGAATDNDRSSVTVPIFFLEKTQTLTITYGATEEGLAVASATTGTDSFRIEVKGSEDGNLQSIRSQPTVRVGGQASGSGRAVLTVRPVGGDSDLYAGDARRRLTITYTAAGQMVGGQVRLTIPPDWSAPTRSTVTVSPSASTRYDGQMVIVEGVNLRANGTLTFVYTADVQPTVETGVNFYVAVHSGISGDSFVDVSGSDTNLTVDVREARRGSGSGTVTPTFVDPGDTGVNLTFTYTAVGEISAPREFRVQVPASWTAPSGAATAPDNKGTYTVTHRYAGVETVASIEKLAPVRRDMIARVRLGGLNVEAGDQIIFTYENADAPTTAELSNFRILFDGEQIQDRTQVGVGTSVPVPDPTPPIDPDPTPPPDPEPDPPPVLIVSATIDKTIAKAGDTVTVTAIGTSGQRATFSVGSILPNVAMTEFPAGTYTGSTSVAHLRDGVHTITVSLNNGPSATAGSLTVDTAAPTVTVQASPATVANGDAVTITATVSEAATSVTADVSALDTTRTTPIPLTLSNNTYSGSFTISDNNQAVSGTQTITVTAMDAAGNNGVGFATVMLTRILEYTSMIPAGTSLFHVPLDVEGLDTVGDLKKRLGSAAKLLIIYDHSTGSWKSNSDAVPITATLGIILSMTAKKTITFEGEAWGDGTSMISLHEGQNLIGLPVDDPDVANVSDIMNLFGGGVVLSITVSTGGNRFLQVSRAGDPGDGPIRGDAAYLVVASGTRETASVTGKAWTNAGAGGAAPIALAGYNVEDQTPVLDLHGTVVDEITGLAREGFRVKVKNLSTKASLHRVTSLEMEAGGYNMTFVDLKSGNAARVGDVLEISADSPSPLIGVQPVRHVVTVDDVKSGILELENLIAYEIPAETELLRNYPNPFNPETWIPYRLAEDADVSLTIYDVNGELVRTIDVGHQSAAVYESRAKAIYWDGRNRFGEQVASGIYFYSLSAGDFSATRKMVILK